MTCFIDTSLQWSGTEPAISLKHVCSNLLRTELAIHGRVESCRRWWDQHTHKTYSKGESITEHSRVSVADSCVLGEWFDNMLKKNGPIMMSEGHFKEFEIYTKVLT